MSDTERKASVARLVAAGHMTRENPGQFTETFAECTEDTIPKYDRDVVRKALPHILEMNFDEDERGCYAVLRDGSTGEEVTIIFGADHPPDNDALIGAIQSHYRGQLDTDAMDATEALFDSMEE